MKLNFCYSLSGASYDERNLPVELNYQVNKRLDLGYDAAALRIYKADQLGNTTHFVRDVNGSFIASYYNGALRYHGLFGPDGSLFGQANGTSRYYFLKDHPSVDGQVLGSVRTTVDFNNTALGYDDYYPFGKIMPGRASSSSTQDDDYKFTGHTLSAHWRKRDAELDLDYSSPEQSRRVLARNYDPLIGRFMQVDPHYFNYTNMTPYAYVGNNPLSFIDPTGRDWYDINGSIVWFDQSGTLEIEFDGKMETYESLGKNVLVSYHNRDSDGNEEINTAIHMLYLASNTVGATARIEGNTIPANILSMNTLAEGIYPAREQARARYKDELALIINEGLNVSNTKGGTMNEIFFHRGNTGRPSLITGQGLNISEGCIVGPSCSGSLPRFNAFMQYLKGFNGKFYLRSNRVKR